MCNVYLVITSPLVVEWSIVMSMSICGSVCLSVCLSPSISHESHDPTSPNFLCALPVTVTTDGRRHMSRLFSTTSTDFRHGQVPSVACRSRKRRGTAAYNHITSLESSSARCSVAMVMPSGRAVLDSSYEGLLTRIWSLSFCTAVYTYKLKFHGTDTDTDFLADFRARILARKSARKSCRCRCRCPCRSRGI